MAAQDGGVIQTACHTAYYRQTSPEHRRSRRKVKIRFDLGPLAEVLISDSFLTTLAHSLDTSLASASSSTRLFHTNTLLLCSDAHHWEDEQQGPHRNHLPRWTRMRTKMPKRRRVCRTWTTRDTTSLGVQNDERTGETKESDKAPSTSTLNKWWGGHDFVVATLPDMLLELRKSRMPKLLSKKPNNRTLPSPSATTACFNAVHIITLSAVPPSSSSTEEDTTSSLTIAIYHDDDQERTWRREQGRLPLLVPPRL